MNNDITLESAEVVAFEQLLNTLTDTPWDLHSTLAPTGLEW